MTADPGEGAWRRAAVIPSLFPGLGEADPGRPRTEIRLLWSPRALFVRCVAEDGDVVAPFTARDADHFQGDVVEVFVAPVGNPHAWYEFEVTPRNGLYDAVHLCTAELRSGPDGVLDDGLLRRDVWTFKEWDCPDVRTAARLTKGGWIVDVAIPPAVLRAAGTDAFRAGPLWANFVRYDVSGRGQDLRRTFWNWSPVVAGRPHRSPARLGILHLL